MRPVLRLGSDGDDVVGLQTILKLLGLLAVVDGDFGPRTKAAVEAFQRDNKLGIDGVVGPRTWAVLEDVTNALPDDADEPGEFGTAGPDDVGEAPSVFVDGWWSRARRVDAHPGRVGGPISPIGAMIHTTDCAPGTMPGIVRRWNEGPGEGSSRGACAHFFIGATPEDGVVQMVSTRRNGNHAGGSRRVGERWIPYHGDYVIGGKVLHPNNLLMGVELDAPGLLQRVAGRGWVHRDSNTTIPDERVYVDSRGKGWGLVNEYQLGMLGELLEAFVPTMAKLPAGTTIAPNGTYAGNGVLWAAVERYRVIGHATLNPNNKTDPGPQVMDWIRARF